MEGTQLSGGEKTKCLKIQVQSQEGGECQEMDRGAEGTDFQGPSYQAGPSQIYWPLGVQLVFFSCVSVLLFIQQTLGTPGLSPGSSDPPWAALLAWGRRGLRGGNWSFSLLTRLGPSSILCAYGRLAHGSPQRALKK